MSESVETNKVKLGFWKYLLFMFQAAIEPIFLTSGLALLFYRFYSVCEEVYVSTGSQNIGDILQALNHDMESDPLIYWVLVGIFVVWILYRAWVLKQRLLQDKFNKNMLETHNTQTKTLNKLASDMDEVKKALKAIEKKLPKG
jgi:hypothetical protein